MGQYQEKLSQRQHTHVHTHRYRANEGRNRHFWRMSFPHPCLLYLILSPTLAQKFVDIYAHTQSCAHTDSQIAQQTEWHQARQTEEDRLRGRRTKRSGAQKKDHFKVCRESQPSAHLVLARPTFREKGPSVSQCSKAALPLLFHSLFPPLCLFVAVQLGCMPCNPGSLYFFY